MGSWLIPVKDPAAILKVYTVLSQSCGLHGSGKTWLKLALDRTAWGLVEDDFAKTDAWFMKEVGRFKHAEIEARWEDSLEAYAREYATKWAAKLEAVSPRQACLGRTGERASRVHGRIAAFFLLDCSGLCGSGGLPIFMKE